MTDLDSNYCPRCGEPVESASEIRATDGEPLPPEAVGVYAERESGDAHAEIGQRGVRVYVHGEDGGGGDEAVTDASPIPDVGRVIETTDDIDDPDEYKCEFCEVTRPEARPLKTHLIAEHAKEVASRHWAEHVDIGVLAADGGVSLPQVIADVLDDAAPGGLDRQILIERVAEVSGATLDEVEEVLGGELRRGAVIESGGEIRKVPNRGLAGRSGRQ